MKDNKRLFLYLLLNVIVSACTILLVLWIWDPENRPASLQPEKQTRVPFLTVSPTANGADQPTEAPDIPTGLIRIDNIIGAGSAASEIVVLRREGEGELELTNWKLQDADGNTFTFPGLTLYKDGAVYIHTAAGVNTVIDLYWNRTDPIWQSGETATLIDSQGKVQATYPIP